VSAAVYRGCVVSSGNAAMLWTVEGGVYAVCGLNCSKSGRRAGRQTHLAAPQSQADQTNSRRNVYSVAGTRRLVWGPSPWRSLSTRARRTSASTPLLLWRQSAGRRRSYRGAVGHAGHTATARCHWWRGGCGQTQTSYCWGWRPIHTERVYVRRATVARRASRASTSVDARLRT